MALHEGLAGLVAEQVRPVAVEQVRNHPRFKYFSEAGEEAYQSFLGVPLIDRGVLQGVLVVQTLEPRAFSEDEIRMLAEAAAQVAPVVSEARTLDRFIAPAQERLWALARNLWWSWDHDSGSIVPRSRPGALARSSITIRFRCCREMPLAEIERRARRTGAARPHQLRLPPAAGISAGRPHLGRDACRAFCGRGRWRIFPPNSACMNRCPIYSGGWACWPAITSRARPTWIFRWSAIGLVLRPGIFPPAAGSRTAGSRKSTLQTDVNQLPMEPAIGEDGRAGHGADRNPQRRRFAPRSGA